MMRLALAAFVSLLLLCCCAEAADDPSYGSAWDQCFLKVYNNNLGDKPWFCDNQQWTSQIFKSIATLPRQDPNKGSNQPKDKKAWFSGGEVVTFKEPIIGTDQSNRQITIRKGTFVARYSEFTKCFQQIDPTSIEILVPYFWCFWSYNPMPNIDHGGRFMRP